MLDITVYRKPTHSGVFTNYTSFVPHYFKVGLVKNASLPCIPDMLNMETLPQRSWVYY